MIRNFIAECPRCHFLNKRHYRTKSKQPLPKHMICDKCEHEFNPWHYAYVAGLEK